MTLPLFLVLENVANGSSGHVVGEALGISLGKSLGISEGISDGLDVGEVLRKALGSGEINDGRSEGIIEG